MADLTQTLIADLEAAGVDTNEWKTEIRGFFSFFFFLFLCENLGGCFSNPGTDSSYLLRKICAGKTDRCCGKKWKGEKSNYFFFFFLLLFFIFPLVVVDKNAVDEVMAMFAGLEESAVRDILAKNDSSIENSMEELFELYTAQKEQQKKNQRQQQLEKTASLLQRGFAGIDKSVIDEIVARHNGEMERASQELLRLMSEQLERDEKKLFEEKTKQIEQKQAEEKRLRGQIQQQLCAQFDVLSTEEVVDVLRRTNYDLPAAVAELREQSQSRKLRNLTHVFSGVKDVNHIKNALELCDYDLGRAFALLTNGELDGANMPVVEEEKVLQQSLAPLNPDNQETQDLLAHMLRKEAGPGGAAAEDLSAAAQKEEKNKELDAAGNGDRPASLKVEVGVNQTQFKYGDSVEVSPVVTGGDASNYDYIGIFTANETDNRNVLVWDWVKSQKSLKLALPSYGLFEVRYLRKVDGVIQTLGASQPLSCGPVLAEMTVEKGADLWKVTWKVDESSEKMGSGAWFGLYNKGADHANYLAFQYASSKTSSLSFKSRHTNGEFEFRFFAYKFQLMKTSEPIVVNFTDSVTIEKVGTQVVLKTCLASVDPSINRKIWVAVCFQNDTRPNKYRRFAFITSPNQSFEFKCPIHTGTYEARIYNEKSVLMVTSKEQINVVEC
jgi:hypothetical protein